MTGKKKFLGIVALMALVAIVGMAVVSPALAQTPTPTPQAQSTTSFIGKGLGWLFGFARGWVQVFDAVAEALKLSPTQLFEQLHSGKTLEEIAEAQGVDLSVVQDAIKQGRVEALKAAIEQAVEDGKLSREQADWLLEGLEKGYLPGGRFGWGCGLGGQPFFRGRGEAPGRGPWGGRMGRFFGFGAPWAPTPPAQGNQS